MTLWLGIPILDIDPEAMSQIVEPFFTTTGIGLGLYLSKERVELNQAQLEYIKPIEFELLSLFRLTLPLSP
nr:hypothetical protein [Rhodospirillales bacterium]